MNKKSGLEEKEKKKKAVKEKEPRVSLQEKATKFADKHYISYSMRVILCASVFILTIALSMFFLVKTLTVEEAKVVNYQENGTLDYKVYLKPNEFYEQEYLGKNMYYIASLIKNITVDVNYQFLIERPVDTNFTYQIVGKLAIAGDQGKNTLYEKEYVLLEKTLEPLSGTTIQSINESLVIDYDYYNEVANRFKATYGVDATSNLTLYVRINKTAKNDSEEININESSNMNLTIPLTQKTLDIQINDTGINNTRSIVKESKVNVGNVFFGIIALVLFVTSVAAILKTLELIFLLVPKKSKYDKYVKKILTEYDRLIVETPTEPRTENKEIIKIKRIEELLDARDNLKRPIMYHSLVDHQKCCFYIENENIIYMLVIKAVDLEELNENKKK